jgi:23S rRNA pseudouridine1911/1915/1917 synthase
MESEPRLVNRLDRETSGLVVIAKSAEVAGELGKIWESRTVTKEYVAIVHGHVAAEQGMIDAPLGKDEASVVAIKDCVRPDGTPAQTEYFVERRFFRHVSREDREVCEEKTPGTNPSSPSRPSRDTVFSVRHSPFTLLRVVPGSGRKHQIRIHLAHIGHPIVGDKIYGGDPDLYLALVEGRLTEEQRKQLLLPNHALHAGRLKFNWREKDWEFASDPEPAFTDFLKD